MSPRVLDQKPRALDQKSRVLEQKPEKKDIYLKMCIVGWRNE